MRRHQLISLIIFLSCCLAAGAQTAPAGRAFGYDAFTRRPSAWAGGVQAGPSVGVRVMGEARQPGQYVLPAGTTLFGALSAAGGVVRPGSLREVQLWRGGRQLLSADLYAFFLGGSGDAATVLADGDVLIVPPCRALVEVAGEVKRPMAYEALPGETAADLLRYAGGVRGGGYPGALRLVRHLPEGRRIYVLDDSLSRTFPLADGDTLSVSLPPRRFRNKVEAGGAVMRPGMYELGDGCMTAAQLVRQAGGLHDAAFAGRVLIYREGQGGDLDVCPLNLSGILADSLPDVPLERGDRLYVPFREDVRAARRVTVSGAVRRPGNYAFAERMTVDDLVALAGGLSEGAFSGSAEVVRRPRDRARREPLSPHEGMERHFVPLGLPVGAAGGDTAFVLQPFDEVYVRRDPMNVPQQHVEIAGEVAFPGVYVLAGKDWRLSDLVREAGGLLEGASAADAHVERRITPQERARWDKVLAQLPGELSEAFRKFRTGGFKSVAVSLEKALQKPGDDRYDLPLESGDRLYVPVRSSTVSVCGEVVRPGKLVWQKGRGLDYYVGQVGGFAPEASRKGTVALLANGDVVRVRRASDIRPGCILLIPSRASGRFFRQALEQDEEASRMLPSILFMLNTTQWQLRD